MQQHLSSLATAAAQPQHTLLRHYFCVVRPEACTLDGYSRAEYVTAVRELRWRRGLTELRTGKHWGAEETGRHRRVAREQRLCHTAWLPSSLAALRILTTLCLIAPSMPPSAPAGPPCLSPQFSSPTDPACLLPAASRPPLPFLCCCAPPRAGSRRDGPLIRGPRLLGVSVSSHPNPRARPPPHCVRAWALGRVLAHRC